MNEKKIFKALFFILLPMFSLVIYLDLNDMHELANLVHFFMGVLFLFYYFSAWKFFVGENGKYLKNMLIFLKKIKKSDKQK